MASRFLTPKGMPLKERLALRSEPQPNGCIHFLGVKCKNGYGKIRVGGGNRSPFLAHRVAYEIAKGKIPKGFYVCHKCDNRICINPDHLFIGNQTDNMQDASDKGRTARGEKCHASKLKASDIPFIRSDKRTQESIAKYYGVKQSVISRIKNRITWKHVP
jgi:hypothetical protein